MGDGREGELTMIDRGPLLDVDQVLAMLPSSNGAPAVSRRFVLANVRPRVDLARGVVRWYRDDVLEWIDSRRSKAA